MHEQLLEEMPWLRLYQVFELLEKCFEYAIPMCTERFSISFLVISLSNEECSLSYRGWCYITEKVLEAKRVVLGLLKGELVCVRVGVLERAARWSGANEYQEYRLGRPYKDVLCLEGTFPSVFRKGPAVIVTIGGKREEYNESYFFDASEVQALVKEDTWVPLHKAKNLAGTVHFKRLTAKREVYI